MPGHGPRLDALYASLVLNIPTPPAGNGNSGSVNFIVMDRVTAWLHDPTRENEERCLEFLSEFRAEGHNTLRKRDDDKTGEPTYAVEQAVPGMHGEYLFAAVAGAMLRAKPSSDLFSAAREYVLDELALCLAFRFDRSSDGDDGVYIPAPRVKEAGPGAKKGQTSAQTGKKPMVPHDGYRDVRLALALGEQVPRPPQHPYWRDPQSIGVWTMRELVSNRKRSGLEAAETIRRRPVPRLFAPITRVSLASGGFLAYLQDTPTVRRNTIDVCNWVVVRPKADKGNGRAPVGRKQQQGGSVEVVAGYDWQPLPDVETVAGSEVTYGA